MKMERLSVEDIEFLKELQHELQTQPNDGNADPVFWTVGEVVKDYGIEDGYEDGHETVTDVNDKPVTINYRNRHQVAENTLFITKRECERHIEKNDYHYTMPHTYAMTAWRSPEVERLFKILKTADWEELAALKQESEKNIDKIPIVEPLYRNKGGVPVFPAEESTVPYQIEATGSEAKHIIELLQAESEGRIAPCSVGDTVYIITKCEKIPTVLDGTLYDSNGGPGTAMGYYCPYEDNCPHDAQDCKPVKGRFAIFEDVVERVIFDEDGTTVYSKYCCCNTLWENAFLYRVEAEAALAAMEGEDNGIR